MDMCDEIQKIVDMLIHYLQQKFSVIIGLKGILQGCEGRRKGPSSKIHRFQVEKRFEERFSTNWG